MGPKRITPYEKLKYAKILTTEYIGKHGIKRQLNSKQEFSLVVYQKYYSLLNQWLQVIHMQGNGKKNSYRKKKNKTKNNKPQLFSCFQNQKQGRELGEP